MATTSPDNIWSPDSGDDYALTVDLAAMADTVQDALNTVKTYRPLTNTERLALTGGDLFEGLIVYTTDTNALWKYDGSAWGLFGFGPFKSTQTQATGSGTVTATSMGALTGISVSQGITTGVACRAKVSLQFRFSANAVGCGAVLSVAGTGATTISPDVGNVGSVQVLQQAINQTNTYSGSWFVNLSAGTTNLSVVGQIIGTGGTRSVAAIGLLVEPVSE